MNKLTSHRFALSLTCGATILLAACGGGSTTADAQTLPAAQTAAAATTVSAATSVDAAAAAAAAPTAAATPAAAAQPTPYGQDASQYALTFNDEFDSFNANVWNDHLWYESSNATKNWNVEGGAMKIWPQRDAGGKFFNRSLDTDGKFSQTYGYFEVEAKLPVGKGTWPAFWLFAHPGDRRPEIDVMEAYAGGTDTGWGVTGADGAAHPTAYGATTWVGDYEGHQAGFKMYQPGIDLSAGFHKYAVKWEKDKQTFYFDGKEVNVVNVSMPDPMYLLLDLWFGSASGAGDDTTPQGPNNSYIVNYVRAWQFK